MKVKFNGKRTHDISNNEVWDAKKHISLKTTQMTHKQIFSAGAGLFTHVRRGPSVCAGVSLFQWPACLLPCCVWLGLAGTRNYSGIQGHESTNTVGKEEMHSTCKFHRSVMLSMGSALLSVLNVSFIWIKSTANMQREQTDQRYASQPMQKAHLKSISGRVMGGRIRQCAANPV